MTEKITVDLVWDAKETLTVKDGKGIIDEHASEAFTHGQCHALAIALHDRTGWPIIGVGGDEETPSHFVVYDPKADTFVDIDGPDAQERFPYEFERMIKEFDREYAIKPPYYLHADLKAARPFAKTVLEQVESLPEKKRKTNAFNYLGKTF